jgi:hypothetical protein
VNLFYSPASINEATLVYYYTTLYFSIDSTTRFLFVRSLERRPFYSRIAVLCYQSLAQSRGCLSPACVNMLSFVSARDVSDGRRVITMRSCCAE